jgi:hypothetical protein
MEKRIYIEPSIVSYLAARPNRDLISAARQQITHDWWENRRADYSLFASSLVVDESSAGNAEAAARRLYFLSGVSLVEIGDDAIELSKALVLQTGLPRKAGVDAVHIAVAACHGLQFLLTWNMAHIANAELRPKIDRVCRDFGLEPPILCTPDALSEV